MRKTPTARLAALCASGLAATLMVAAPMALAQQQQPSGPAKAQEPAAPAAPTAGAPAPAAAAAAPQQGQEEMAGDGEYVYERPQVGDATQSLFAWQRGGEMSSATPRTIAGDVANRSYQRYLKSFEYPIPERMTSSVKATSGGGGSGAGGDAPK